MSRFLSIVCIIVLLGIAIIYTNTDTGITPSEKQEAGQSKGGKERVVLPVPALTIAVVDEKESLPKHPKTVAETRKLLDMLRAQVVGVVARRAIPGYPIDMEDSGLVPQISSGVIITQDGLVVARLHAVEHAPRLEIHLHGGTKKVAKVVGIDPWSDTALLKIDGGPYRPVIWGNSEELEAGKKILSYTHTFALGGRLNQGYVTSVNLYGSAWMRDGHYQKYFEHNMTDHPGDAGGGIFNLEGELLGMRSKSLLGDAFGKDGIGYAVPGNLMRFVVESLMLQGKVTRGTLGVVSQDLNGDLAESLGLDRLTEGVLISSVVGGDEAAFPLKRGDVIVQFDRKNVSSAHELRLQVSQMHIGDEIAATVLRNGKKFNVTIGIKEAPLDFTIIEDYVPPPLEEGGAVNAHLLTGVKAVELTQLSREQYGIRSPSGLLVSEVSPVSPARFSGLEPGMLILEVNRSPVADLAAFGKSLETVIDRDKVLLLVEHEQVLQYLMIQ